MEATTAFDPTTIESFPNVRKTSAGTAHTEDTGDSDFETYEDSPIESDNDSEASEVSTLAAIAKASEESTKTTLDSPDATNADTSNEATCEIRKVANQKDNAIQISSDNLFEYPIELASMNADITLGEIQTAAVTSFHTPEDNSIEFPEFTSFESPTEPAAISLEEISEDCAVETLERFTFGYWEEIVIEMPEDNPTEIAMQETTSEAAPIDAPNEATSETRKESCFDVAEQTAIDIPEAAPTDISNEEIGQTRKVSFFVAPLETAIEMRDETHEPKGVCWNIVRCVFRPIFPCLPYFL